MFEEGLSLEKLRHIKTRKGDDFDHWIKLVKGGFRKYMVTHGSIKGVLIMLIVTFILVISGGYVLVEELLAHKMFQHFTEADIRRVVATNDKQRFSLKTNDIGQLMICANQGHSFEVRFFSSFFFL